MNPVPELRLRLVTARLNLGTAITRVIPLEMPPPGAGLLTRTATLPIVAMSAAGMSAVSRVGESRWVVLGLPFQVTRDVVLKFVPLTRRVNRGPPATTRVGVMAVTVGKG